MRQTRILLTLLCLFGALAVVAPAVALAGSGPSAGDQQYVDPLSGGSHHHSSTTSGSSSTPTPAASTSSSTAGATAVASTTASSSTTATPTAATSSGKTLPFTGLNVPLAVAVGVLMLGAGAGIRRSARRPG